MRMRAMDVIAASAARIRQQGQAEAFSAITTDSRQVKRGALFCALAGEHFDGHDYVRVAFRKGAAGALIQKRRRVHAPQRGWLLTVDDTLHALGAVAAKWRSHFAIPLIAVTGSNGKTTTKEMIAALLSTHYRVLKTEYNYNNLIGLPWTLFRMTNRHQAAVVELGMNAPGEISRLAQIAQAQVAVITNVARAHLEGVGSLAGVARAKAEILQHLPPDGLAVLNADDARVMKMAQQSPAPVRTYGFGADAEIRGHHYKSDLLKGCHFQVRIGSNHVDVHLDLPGRHNVLNALAAIAVADHFNIPHRSWTRGLRHIQLPYGRMTRTRLPNGALLINDSYNANPDSVREALKQLANLKTKQRKIVVLGTMLELGAHSVRAHREIGRAAVAAGTDLLFAVGPWSDHIIRGARNGHFSSKQIYHCETAQAAGSILSDMVQRGDVILLKGSRDIHLESIIEDLQSLRNAR